MSDHTAGLSEETQTERMATMALDMENAARIALREPVGRRNRPVKFRIVLVGGPVLYAVVGRQVLLVSILVKMSCLFHLSLCLAPPLLRSWPDGEVGRAPLGSLSAG